MIAQIGRDDVAFKPYRIYIKDFVDAVGTSHKGEYERAREITGEPYEACHRDTERERLLANFVF
jgi:hypothetical protein